jgi:23S rRNA (uridine2552-2'-O)-methyltransferase
VTTWKRGETYRRQARASGYRSRAAFKLLEIEKRFHVLQRARKVVDLCCAPGGWLQVAVKSCGAPNCRIVGVDLAQVKPIEGVELIRTSIDAPDLPSRILERLGGRATVVLSDCSPKLTGNKTVDRERQVWQAQTSLDLALQLLDRNGHFIAKVFESNQAQEVEAQARTLFQSVRIFKPKASFRSSPEVYLVAKGFLGAAPKTARYAP